VDQQKALPRWLIVGAIIVSILGLVVMAGLEISDIKYPNWTSFLLVALLYIPIQIVVEGILSAYWDNPKWAVKTVPVVLLAGFYGSLFLIK
jgi:uncharacterized membrane protein